MLALHGWVWMILGWLAMSSVLALCLWTSDRLLTGREGNAPQLLAATRSRLQARELPVGQSENAAGRGMV